MSCTVPQVAMLNHACTVNGENFKRRHEAETGEEKPKKRKKKQSSAPPDGCPDFDKMSSAQTVAYVLSGGDD